MPFIVDEFVMSMYLWFHMVDIIINTHGREIFLKNGFIIYHLYIKMKNPLMKIDINKIINYFEIGKLTNECGLCRLGDCIGKAI